MRHRIPVLLLVGLTGCTALRPGTDRPSLDAGVASPDASFDAAPRDGAMDAGPEDAALDAGVDDAGGDAGRDAGPDADAGPRPCPPLDARPILPVSGDITEPTRWTCDQTYELRGVVAVRDVLTIDPDVTVLGGGDDDLARLVVTPTGRLEAIGTSDAPIRFTHESRVPGRWGGVALLGDAPLGPGAAVSIPVGPTVPGTSFGGTDADHDCGTLRFVTIDYGANGPGGDSEQNDRLDNGLTLAGCGTATQVEDVRVAFPEDDGLVLLGGAPDVRRIYLYQTPDEGVEWDLGFDGTVQFVVIHHTNAGDDGVQSSHSRSDTARGAPVFANITLAHVDPEGDDVLSIEDGTTGTFVNLVAVGFDEDAVDVVAESGVIEVPDVQHSLFFNTMTRHFFETGPSPDRDDDMGFDEEAVYMNAARNNCFGMDPTLALSARTYTISPPGGCTAVDPTTLDSRLEAAPYLGAVPPTGPSWITWMVE